MKKLNLIFAVLLILVISAGATAQAQDQGKNSSPSVKTESFKVSGNCSMCKDRIEKAVKDEGATSGSWDSKTKLLTVSYDPSKTNTDALSKKLASVGHDNDKYKAPDDVYAKLPGCCHYERAK